MAPPCPVCHTCLYRGAAADAGRVLGDVLAWFQIKHGQPFAAANNDLTLGTTLGAVLNMYGLN